MVEPEKFNQEVAKLDTLLLKGAQKPGEPPPWWESDEEATQSGLRAARMLGFKVDLD
jgi:hypothetical protein